MPLPLPGKGGDGGKRDDDTGSALALTLPQKEWEQDEIDLSSYPFSVALWKFFKQRDALGAHDQMPTAL